MCIPGEIARSNCFSGGIYVYDELFGGAEHACCVAYTIDVFSYTSYI